MTLKRLNIDEETSWKWVICHLGIYVTDAYPDLEDASLNELENDTESDGKDLKEETFIDEELATKPKPPPFSWGIHAGIVMPWDKKFIELSENDDYLEDFFVNKNVTKTDENTIKDDTKDKDKGVFVIPTNPILIDTKIAEEEEEIYEVEVAGI